MKLTKQPLVLKSFFLSLVLMGSVQKTFSCSAENDFVEQQGFKRKLVQAEETKIPLDDKGSVLCSRLSEYVQFYDLCSLESVCKKFAETIRNSRQYEALVFDYKDKNGWKNGSSPTFKDLFINLKSNNLNYMVHFSALWLDHFPFNMSSGWTNPLPLPYYWEKSISSLQKSTIHAIFGSVEQLASASFIPRSYFYYKSIVYGILTEKDENADFIKQREKLTNIINQTDGQCLQETKIDAQLRLALMDTKGRGGPINYVAARQGFNSVFNSTAALTRQKSIAQLCLADMDAKGRGGPVNHESARQGFNDVLNYDDASPLTKAAAQYLLAEMDLLGQGGPVNHGAARQGFNNVIINNEAPPQYRATAQFYLAEMDLLGQGGPVKHVDARQGFNSVFNNNVARPQDKAAAQSYLAEMDLFGQGGPVNRVAARQGFNDILSNNAANLQKRAIAQFYLAEMDLLGHGGPVNYGAARQGFNSVFNNNAASPQTKAAARYHSAVMELLGQGGPINHVAARQGFNDVLNAHAANPQDKAVAQYYLAEMDRTGVGR